MLLLAVVGLQALSCMAPYVTLFVYSPNIFESYVANVADYFSMPLLLFWLWFAAIGLIGAGGYWSTEAGSRFHLEALRHRSFSAWLGRKLGTVAAVCLLVYGAVPFAFLVAIYPGQGGAVLLASLLLASYGLHLALVLLGLSMLGLRTGYAFVGVLAYHFANLAFNHADLPNIIRYFLIAGHGDILSLLVSIFGIVALFVIIFRLLRPSHITTRGSEFL
ncbi:MAG: hypothetical protein KGZ40_08340 [Clostridiales bacterium]|nr:hypothetical protein [Clostridiales bacterium]